MPLQAAPFSAKGPESEDDSSEIPPPQETPPVDEGEDRVGRRSPHEYGTVDQKTEENGVPSVVELSDENETPQTETTERDPSDTTTTNGDIESGESSDDTSTNFWIDESTESIIRERHNGVPYVLVLNASGHYVGWLPYTSTVEDCKAYMRSSYGNGFTFIYIGSDGYPTKELFIVDDNVSLTSHYSDEVRRITRDEDKRREDEAKIPIDIGSGGVILPIGTRPRSGGHPFTGLGNDLFSHVNDELSSRSEDNSSDSGSDSGSDDDDEFDWDTYMEWLSSDEGMETAGGAIEH